MPHWTWTKKWRTHFWFHMRSGKGLIQVEKIASPAGTACSISFVCYSLREAQRHTNFAATPHQLIVLWVFRGFEGSLVLVCSWEYCPSKEIYTARHGQEQSWSKRYKRLIMQHRLRQLIGASVLCSRSYKKSVVRLGIEAKLLGIILCTRLLANHVLPEECITFFFLFKYCK